MAPLGQRSVLRAECRGLRRAWISRLLFGQMGLLAGTIPAAALLLVVLIGGGSLGEASRAAILAQLAVAGVFNAWYYAAPIQAARTREKLLRRALRRAE